MMIAALRAVTLHCAAVVPALCAMAIGGCTLTRVEPDGLARSVALAQSSALLGVPRLELAQIGSGEVRVSAEKIMIVRIASDMQWPLSITSPGITFDVSKRPHGVIYHTFANENPAGHFLTWAGWRAGASIPTDDRLEFLAPTDDADDGRSDRNGRMPLLVDYSQFASLYLPTDAPVRGLVIMFSGLDFGWYDGAMRDELIADGWAILSVPLTAIHHLFGQIRWSTSTRSPSDFAAYLEKVLGREFGVIGASLSSMASFAKERVPGLDDGPMVVIGSSAGSLLTPAIVDYLDQEIDAVVLVGAGADIVKLSECSATNLKLLDEHGEPVPLERVRELRSEFLRITRTDPYVLAPRLAEQPTLIVQARWDRIVPRKLGDLLWERAGKPERWLFPGGHFGLYLTMGFWADDVVDWINDATSDHPSSLVGE